MDLKCREALYAILFGDMSWFFGTQLDVRLFLAIRRESQEMRCDRAEQSQSQSQSQRQVWCDWIVTSYVICNGTATEAAAERERACKPSPSFPSFSCILEDQLVAVGNDVSAKKGRQTLEVVGDRATKDTYRQDFFFLMATFYEPPSPEPLYTPLSKDTNSDRSMSPMSPKSIAAALGAAAAAGRRSGSFERGRRKAHPPAPGLEDWTMSPVISIGRNDNAGSTRGTANESGDGDEGGKLQDVASVAVPTPAPPPPCFSSSEPAFNSRH